MSWACALASRCAVIDFTKAPARSVMDQHGDCSVADMDTVWVHALLIARGVEQQRAHHSAVCHERECRAGALDGQLFDRRDGTIIQVEKAFGATARQVLAGQD